LLRAVTPEPDDAGVEVAPDPEPVVVDPPDELLANGFESLEIIASVRFKETRV
jgi:hypothetical protein